MTFQTNQHAAAAAKKKKQTVSPNHEAHLVEQHNHAPSHKRGYKPSASAGSDVAANLPPVPAASEEVPPVPVAMPAPMPVLNESDVNAPAPPTPQIVPPAYSVGLRNLPFVPAAATPSAAGISGFRATVPPSPAHAASSTVLTAGGHQEMVLPLSEAAPELFGGNPAAATPHYDALGAAGAGVAAGGNIVASNMAAPIMPKNAAGTVTPIGYGNQTAGLPPLPRAAAAGGFRATVPPSPAHGASTAILGSGSHQEMVLPLSEAAPELFGGNPAASTPHYDAMAAAPTAPAVAGTAAPFVPSAPVTATPYATPLGGAAGLPTPVSTLPRATPSYSAAGAVPPSPSGGIRATVAPSPAHAASTAVLGSGSHQEMVLPLSEAAPELFGGNPAASTPHYDAMAAAAPAATAAPFIAAAPVTATPMNYAPAAANVTPSYRAMGALPPTPSGGLRATVAPSPAHAASTTMLGSGSHQEMVLPLSEAAPELFGGNPAASTPHYDAMAAAGPVASAAGPAAVPFVSAAPVTATPVNFASATAGGIPLAASGVRATVPPSPAHAASTTMLGSGGHQELVLPLSEAAPELFGGNPAASTPHYDAVA